MRGMEKERVEKEGKKKKLRVEGSQVPGTQLGGIVKEREKTMAGRGRRSVQSRRYEQNRKLKNFVKGLKPSVRSRLLELDSRILGELLGVTTQQENGARSLPEGEATPKENMIKPFQRQDKKKEKPLESQQSTVASSIEKPECTQCGKRHGGKACWRRKEGVLNVEAKIIGLKSVRI
ncbi:hypothetical protein Taro_006881 [Colocasia esculenta]|uniref:Uncharacterized protein n=1 Tax=Colocasia esculenta TaxID=4460 RepID=A0A843TTM8_COLES|nr:hypothetical protein [Colocasia esculenta]